VLPTAPLAVDAGRALRRPLRHAYELLEALQAHIGVGQGAQLQEARENGRSQPSG
jgi:hypothetical protein